MPVYGREAVATSQPLAAQAGLDVLARGGNAVDAALACAIALTVVEPTSNGLGSDAFALVWDGGALHGFNGSGRSPAGLDPARFAGMGAMPQQGWDAVTVPGAVDCWVHLSDRFGRLPFAGLFTAAIGYARRGYPVGPQTAAAWARSVTRFAAFPDFIETFTVNGRAPGVGDVFALPDHADTLEAIAQSKGESFYRGALAQRIVECAARAGSPFAAEDLAIHKGEWVDPISAKYRDAEVFELPPNGQGIAALVALGVLDRFEMRGFAPGSVEGIHLQVEAMKAGLAELHAHVADPDAMRVTHEQLLSPDVLDAHAAGIDGERASMPRTQVRPDHGTVYLTAADAEGMMVSFIQSNYMGFGSGVVVPSTGIALQNRGAGFVLEPGHVNAVAPGKRPLHTIVPAFVMRGGEPLMSFGVMGGPMQPQGHVQMVTRVVDHDQCPQAACDAPRWFVDQAGRLALEKRTPGKVVEALQERGHTLIGPANPPFFGGAQLIVRLSDGTYCAASDHRRDGQAVGR